MAERIHLFRIGHGYAITGSLPPATIGDAYSRTLTAIGGAGTKRLELISETVPDAIVFTDNGDSTAEFAIADPQAPGTYSVVVRATDANRQRWTRTFAFQIIALPVTISDTLPDITVGAVYLQTLQINDGIPPYFLNSDTVPAGMSAYVGGDEIFLEGPASGAGLGPGTTFPFTVEFEIEDSSVPPQTATYSQLLNILVTPVVAVFDPSSLPNAFVGAAYTADTEASGGTTDTGVTFAKQAGPSWLSVNSGSGALTGTPAFGDIATGVTITVRATDSEGNIDDVTDTIDVAAAVDPDALSIYNKIVEWWEGDETSGTTAVGSHAAIDGTYSASMALNQTALASGLAPCLSSAANGEISISSASSAAVTLTGDFAVMTWFSRGSQTDAFPVLLWKDVGDMFNGRANYELFLLTASSNALYFRVNQSGGGYVDAAGSSTSASTTYLAIGMRTGNDLELYRNNSLDASNIGNSTSVMTATGGLHTGVGESSGTNFRYIGKIGSRAIFNDALTSDERDYLWNGGNGVTYAALKAAAGF